MPDPEAAQNSQMPHTPDLQGGKCPAIARAGGGGTLGEAAIDWCITRDLSYIASISEFEFRTNPGLS